MAREPMPRWKLYLFCLLPLVATLALAELAAKVTTVRVLGIQTSRYDDYYRNDPNRLLLTWMDPYETHPYFGYVHPRTYRNAVATLGTRTEGDYVIGVLGGSVAENFANFLLQHPDYQARFRDVIPQVGDRTIRIVNLAAGGYKQPQQFFIASFFLDKLDCLVTLDGFNDVTSQDFTPLYPMEFPVLSLRLYAHGAAATALRTFGNALKWLYTRMEALPLKLTVVSRSHLYFVFWQTVHPLLYGAIQFVDDRFYASAVGRRRPSEPAAGSAEQKLAIWRRFTLLQAHLAKAVGKPALFFVQPSQYLRGSKPLSEEERRRAFNPVGADAVDRGMRLARGAVPELRQSGVQIFDVTHAFVDVEETLYVDACCHFNAHGNQILADAVLGILARHASDLWRPDD